MTNNLVLAKQLLKQLIAHDDKCGLSKKNALFSIIIHHAEQFIQPPGPKPKKTIIGNIAWANMTFDNARSDGMEPSTRLHNIMCSSRTMREMMLGNITFETFMMFRNTGKGTWKELQTLIGK